MTEFDYARVQVVLLSLMSLSWLWYAHSLHTYNKVKAKYAKEQLEIMNSILIPSAKYAKEQLEFIDNILVPGAKDIIKGIDSVRVDIAAARDIIKDFKSESNERDASNDAIKEMLNR